MHNVSCLFACQSILIKTSTRKHLCATTMTQLLHFLQCATQHRSPYAHALPNNRQYFGFPHFYLPNTNYITNYHIVLQNKTSQLLHIYTQYHAVAKTLPCSTKIHNEQISFILLKITFYTYNALLRNALYYGYYGNFFLKKQLYYIS